MAETPDLGADCPCMGANLLRLLQPALLALLAAGERHGYQLLDELGRLPSFTGQRPDTGGTYRTLNTLEERGLVSSRWEPGEQGPARRCYAITSRGRACLERWVGTITDYQASLDQLRRTCITALAAKPIKLPVKPRRP